MTVKQLREMLAVQDQDAEVLSYDGDGDVDMPVTGCVFAGNFVDGSQVLLQTDEL